MSTSIRTRVEALERENGDTGEPPIAVIVLCPLVRPGDEEPHARVSTTIGDVTLRSEPGESQDEFIERVGAYAVAHRPRGRDQIPLAPLIAVEPQDIAMRGDGSLEQRTQSAHGGNDAE